MFLSPNDRYDTCSSFFGRLSRDFHPDELPQNRKRKKIIVRSFHSPWRLHPTHPMPPPLARSLRLPPAPSSRPPPGPFFLPPLGQSSPTAACAYGRPLSPSPRPARAHRRPAPSLACCHLPLHPPATVAARILAKACRRPIPTPPLLASRRGRDGGALHLPIPRLSCILRKKKDKKMHVASLCFRCFRCFKDMLHMCS
jgi:hypothetical protein